MEKLVDFPTRSLSRLLTVLDVVIHCGTGTLARIPILPVLRASAVSFWFFRCTNHSDYPISPSCFTTLLSSSTCRFGGQFFQSWRQQTIKSHCRAS
jgi:hypothetical protein